MVVNFSGSKVAINDDKISGVSLGIFCYFSYRPSRIMSKPFGGFLTFPAWDLVKGRFSRKPKVSVLELFSPGGES